MYRVLHISTGLWAHAFLVGRSSGDKCALLFSDPNDFSIYPSINNITSYMIGFGYSNDTQTCTSSEFEVINV